MHDNILINNSVNVMFIPTQTLFVHCPLYSELTIIYSVTLPVTPSFLTANVDTDTEGDGDQCLRSNLNIPEVPWQENIQQSMQVISMCSIFYVICNFNPPVFYHEIKRHHLEYLRF